MIYTQIFQRFKSEVMSWTEQRTIDTDGILY